MSKTVVEIEILRAGQPRPFTDSEYAATIKAERHGVYVDGRVVPCYLSEEEVKSIVQMFVKKFEENPTMWHQARLRKLSPKNSKVVYGTTKASEWEVLVVEPFTD